MDRAWQLPIAETVPSLALELVPLTQLRDHRASALQLALHHSVVAQCQEIADLPLHTCKRKSGPALQVLGLSVLAASLPRVI